MEKNRIFTGEVVHPVNEGYAFCDLFQYLDPEGMSMKNRIWLLVWAMFLVMAQWSGAANAAEQKIRVLNPRGIMPSIKRVPMAKRPSTLVGKTIYIVNDKFPDTRKFVNAVHDNLAAAYPKTKWIAVDKRGNYTQDDPKLWATIKAKGDGAIILLGH